MRRRGPSKRQLQARQQELELCQAMLKTIEVLAVITVQKQKEST